MTLCSPSYVNSYFYTDFHNSPAFELLPPSVVASPSSQQAESTAWAIVVDGPHGFDSMIVGYYDGDNLVCGEDSERILEQILASKFKGNRRL
jgi:hypothetical protein